MLVLMQPGSSQGDTDRVLRRLEELGHTGRAATVPGGVVVGATGDGPPLDPALLRSLPGVLRVVALSSPFPLASRESHPADTSVGVGPLRIGGGPLTIIAGPCAVESEEQIVGIAREVKIAGADLLRGGAFKPRTSPYSFQGLGERGLKMLARAREETGLPVVTEALDHASLELVQRYADVVQVGARNMQNFSLLRSVGRSGLPVFLKRGIAASLDELLQAAEYILAEGNPNVMLCERGIRTFAQHDRYTLDLSILPAAREATHLPMFVDPSHGTGARAHVGPMARAAVAAGADGLIIEVHDVPARARCDGPQALPPAEFATLATELRALARHVSNRAETVS